MAQAVETPETVSVASGATDVFATVWTFERPEEVRVSVASGGVTVEQARGVAFVVAPGDWLNDGGDVVFQPGHRPPVGAVVTRYRITPAAQQAQGLGDLDTFRPQRNEEAFDRLTRMVQEVRVGVDRAVKAPPGGSPPDPQSVLDAAEAVFNKQDKINAPTPLGLAFATPRATADRLSMETAVAGRDFGVAADGSTNDQPAIQRLIDHARDNGRAMTIILPPVGTVGLGAAVDINGDHIFVEGPGRSALHNSGNPAPGVALVPLGGYSGPLMRHRSRVNPTGAKIKGGGFVGLTTRGNPGQALVVTSVLAGSYDLYCEGVTGEAAVVFETLKDYRAALANRQLGEAGDNQQFYLKLRGRITGENAANAAAHGVVFRGCGTTEGGNTSAARRIDIDMRTENGHMVLVEAADTLAMELRHEGLGTGRCLYVKGATANTVVDDIYAYIAANTQAKFEGTETAGVIAAPGGLITTDRNNGTPRPIIGTGCNVVVTDPDLQIGMRMVAALSAGDIFGLNLLRAAVAANAGLAAGDSGAGALTLRMASGGRMVWGESSATRARALLQNGLTGIDLNGDFASTRLTATAGGLTQKPTPGWKSSHAPLELFCEVVPGATEADPATMRWFWKTAGGVVKAAFITMPTL